MHLYDLQFHLLQYLPVARKEHLLMSEHVTSWMAALLFYQKMASKRYYDWVITTPLMLLATIMYMKYLEFRENKIDPQGSIIKFNDFLRENSVNISKITVSNFIMLVFGYLGEIDIMDIVNSVIFGSVFFLLSINRPDYQHVKLRSLPGRLRCVQTSNIQ